jgi:hypothetical protein
MFAVFSLVEDIPTIHKIYVSEETTNKSFNDLVISYIQQNRKDDKCPLTIPLSEIKTDTFTYYPIRTYLVIDGSMIEIYEHSLIDKVEKGWVWNGTMKAVESKKIGYFQVLKVNDSIIEDQPKEYKSLTSEMDDLIEEIMNEISDTRFTLEKEIEDVKNLQFDLQKFTEQDRPILLNYDEKELSLPVLPSTNIPYLLSLTGTQDLSNKVGHNEYPKQPETSCMGDFNRKYLKTFEEKYLPFLDDEVKENEESNEDKETIVHNEDIEWSQRCRSNRRGINNRARASRGRSNMMRKMRLRSW